MFAKLEGVTELGDRLAALPQLLRDNLEAKTRELADALVAKIRDEKLSGGVLQTRSGALKNSIGAEIGFDGDGVNAVVGSFGDVKYAAIQEYGGRTAAHEILPDKARALAFLVGGGMTFAGRVEHPGSQIPGAHYLAASLEEMREQIVAELGQAAEEALEA